MRATPRCCAYSAKPLRARSGPKMRSSSAIKSASRACPRQNTGWVLAVRSNTSTNSNAWLVSCADGLRQSETSTYAPTLASRLQNTACVRWSSPLRPNSASGLSQASPHGPWSKKPSSSQPDLASEGSISV